jgi:hypothetical protein
MLVGDSDLPLAELPPAMSAHAVIGDPSTQDLYVIGLLGDFIGNAVSGTLLRPVGVRYGLRVGRGDARIVVGPADLLPALNPLPRGVVLSGGVATSMAGTTLAVGLSTGSALYFLDTRTLKPQSVASLGASVSLAGSGTSPQLTKVGSMVGLGTQIYAADLSAPVVARVDLMTGAVAACAVDAQVLGLSVSGGQVQAATAKGTATLSPTCGMASTPSTGTPPMAPSALSLSMPQRTFTLSERVLEMSFLNPQGPPETPGMFSSMKGQYWLGREQCAARSRACAVAVALAPRARASSAGVSLAGWG